ncbi:ribonuclease H-like domain-containing protein [Tanacetum coccineum]
MSGEEPTTQIAPVESPQMVSTIKFPILKKGEYTLWSMRMEQYLTNIDYSLWQVILNGDGPIQVTTDENGVEIKVPPKTAQALLQRQRERKAKRILLLAILDKYQLRFHGIKDAKSLWAAIKSRFGGNVESKKMQKNVLKQQFENFSVSDTEGLDKAYDRFQKLISLLEVHGAAVSNEDANQKNLRALPSSWNNVALIMRKQDGIDDLDIGDLYNNLKVFEADIKGSSRSSSNSQNVAFLSAKDTSSSNEVNTTNGVSTASGHNSQGQASSSSYTDDLMFSFFANQSNSPQLDDEDLEQIDHDDLEEMDLKWQVLIKLMLNALTVIEGAILQGNVEHQEIKGTGIEMQDGMGYDWSYIAQDEPIKLALLAYTSNSSGSDTELGLESVEAQLVINYKNEVVYEEKIVVLEFKVKDKRYGDQLNEHDSSGSELFNSVFHSRSSDGDDNQTNDRFKKDNGFHSVPTYLTGNYMPPLTDLSFTGLYDSVYRPTANKTSVSVSQVEASTSQTSNTSVEMPGVESVRPSGVIIEDWVSDDEDFFQSNDLQATDKPSFKRIEFTNARNESVKPKQAEKPRIITQNPKVDRRDWDGKMTQKLGLGFGFTKKACFVCGSYSHLIKDCDFHEKKWLKTVSTVKGTGVTAVKASAGCVWRPKMTDLNNVSKDNSGSWVSKRGNPQQALKNKGIFDSGCSRHMTGNKDFLTDYQDIDGGFVAFGGSARGGKITGKGKIRTDKLDFEDVFFVKELKFNLFSVSQMCDKKNSVLFTETNRFSWVFFLSLLGLRLWDFLKRFITEIENQLNHKVKVIRCDNGIEFKNREMNEFYGLKEIKREFSVAKTPQQNEVVERKNRTLIEAARTMLPNSLLPTVFWAKAVNIACYVLNRVLVTKPYNKTPYELIIGRPPSISFMRPFGCPVTILNTLDPLGKFDGKAEEGFLVGYKSSNETYKNDIADDVVGETPVQKPASKNEQALKNVLDKMMDQEKEVLEQSDAVRKEFEAQCNMELLQRKATKVSSTNSFNTVSTPVNVANDPLMPDLEDTAEVQNIDIFGNRFNGFDDETVDAATTGVSIASTPITTAGVAISTAEPRTPPTTTTVFDDEDVTMEMA